jgi:hypothetical protein
MGMRWLELVQNHVHCINSAETWIIKKLMLWVMKPYSFVDG